MRGDNVRPIIISSANEGFRSGESGMVTFNILMKDLLVFQITQCVKQLL